MKIEAHAISVHVQSNLILENVSAHLETGEMIGLVGPNGSGKTTLIRALTNLLPLSEGEITLDSCPVEKINRNKFAKQVSYLPQDSRSHWPLQVRSIVELGRLPYASDRHPSQIDDDIVHQAMVATSVIDSATRKMSELSGGERQRVLLARTLAVGAPLILADEPLAALDPHHQISIMDVLRSVADAGRGVLIALHDLSLAARFCDRLLLLANGKVVRSGTADQVLDRSVLSDVYGVEVICGKTEGISFFLPKLAINRRGQRIR